MCARIHRISVVVACLFFVGACGSPDPQDKADDDQTQNSDPASAATSTLDPSGFVNAFSFKSSGGVEWEWKGDRITLTGGCVPSEPMSIGFHEGLPTSADYFSIGFDGAEPVGTGETGTFGIKEIRWDHGTVLRTVPGGMEVRVPNRFTGAGSIAITNHLATVQNRRLEGTVTGTASGEEGVSADVTIAFDINLSCGVSM